MPSSKSSIFPSVAEIPLDAWWTQNGVQIMMSGTTYKIYEGDTNALIGTGVVTQVDDGKFHDVFTFSGLSFVEHRIEYVGTTDQGNILEQMDFFQVSPWFDQLDDIENKTFSIPEVPAASINVAKAGITVDTDLQQVDVKCWLETDGVRQLGAQTAEFKFEDVFGTVVFTASGSTTDAEGFFNFEVTGITLISPQIYRGRCRIYPSSGVEVETFRTYTTAGGS